jgi:LacI family transcriptional regulator
MDSIRKDGLPDGIFAMSDETLIGVMQAVYELGVNVPDQVSIVAISDGEFPEFFNPKITYIETSGYKVGKAAAELLMKLIENDHPHDEQIIIDTPLISRDSI